MKEWLIFHNGETTHAVPEQDLKPHTDTGEWCKCEPRVVNMENGNRVFVHNPYDGREFFERENI